MRSWLEISLPTIAANFRAIRALAPGVEMVPVVKADAYGHGIIRVAQALEKEGARWFAVSSFQEGLQLRNAGCGARILVMADTGFDSAAHAGLTPVVHSLAEIPNVPYHLKIDTGMHRLGVRGGVEEIAEAVKGTPIEGIMTHFASSSNFVVPQTGEQLEAFERVLTKVKPQYVHAASTNPLHFGLGDSWFNMARPGLALYGYVSQPKGTAPAQLLRVKPALVWKARIIAVKDVAEGGLIGYGGTFRAKRKMRIAIVGAGYADGVSRRLTNKGKFTGAVSMDVSTIDISATPDLRPGDAVTLLGPGYDARDMARDSGTIAYSVLTGISARVSHVYTD
jgi:alanine racemase